MTNYAEWLTGLSWALTSGTILAATFAVYGFMTYVTKKPFTPENQKGTSVLRQLSASMLDVFMRCYAFVLVGSVIKLYWLFYYKQVGVMILAIDMLQKGILLLEL